MFEKNLNVSLTTPQKKRKYPIYPEIPGNTQEYPEISDSKKDTRKYPIIYFNTPIRPEPDRLPGIFSNTRPDVEKPNPYPLGTGDRVFNLPIPKMSIYQGDNFHVAVPLSRVINFHGHRRLVTRTS